MGKIERAYSVGRLRTAGRDFFNREGIIRARTTPDAVLGRLQEVNPPGFGDNPLGTTFTNRAAYRLSDERSIVGLTHKLPGNSKILLDRGLWEEKELYMIHAADGGMRFTFTVDSENGTPENLARIAAEGISQFLNATPEQRKESDELIEKIRKHERDSAIARRFTLGPALTELDIMDNV